MLSLYYAGSGAVTVLAPAQTSPGITYLTNFTGGTANVVSNNGTLSSVFLYQVVFQVATTSASISFTSGVGLLPSGTLVLDLFLLPLPFGAM